MNKIKTQNARPFLLENGEHGILLIHGFTGSASHMRLIGDILYEEGFTVYGINLPGHGTTIEDMKKYDWHDWLSAVNKAYDLLREKCKKVSVAGLSMGGVLSLILAQNKEVGSVVSLSTPMGVKNKFAPLARYLAPVFPMVRSRISAQRAIDLNQDYDYGYVGFPTARAGDLMALIKIAKANLNKITCPILIVQSRDDQTITPSSGDVIYNGVMSKVKKMLWLTGVPHVITISKEYQTIGREIAVFLKGN